MVLYMRINILLRLIKKEITDIIRDKKTILSMILIPILLYPLLLIGFTMISQTLQSDAIASATSIYIGGDVPESFVEFVDDEYDGVLDITHDKSTNSTYDLYFHSSDNVVIEYNSTLIDQGFSSGNFENLFDEYKVYLLESTIDDHEIEINAIEFEELHFFDLASDTEIIAKALGQLLPMLLLLGVVLGVIYPAIDIVTGEKERNTLETLLSLPITPLEIVASKFITISLCGIVSTLLNVISIGLSIWYIVFSITSGIENGGSLSIDYTLLVFPLFVTSICLVSFSFFVSAITMIVVSIAKSFKEAQNYCTPLMLLILIPAYFTTMPSITLSYSNSFIPILNISLAVKEIFTFDGNLVQISLVILSNLLYCAITIVLLSKSYASESILFSNQKSIKLFDGRRKLNYSGIPGSGDGILLFSVGLVILFYASGIIASFTSNIVISVFIIQTIIFILPVSYCIYTRSSIVETFSLRKFSLKYLLIGIPLVIISLFLVIVIQNILLMLIPSLATFVEQFSDLIVFNNFFLQVLCIAILPAICEEVFFRGFLLKAFKVDKKPFFAILVTSILFGIYHMNILQLVTGFFLGGTLGYITYKSKSIYPAILLHFLNNFLAIIIDKIF